MHAKHQQQTFHMLEPANQDIISWTAFLPLHQRAPALQRGIFLYVVCVSWTILPPFHLLDILTMD